MKRILILIYLLIVHISCSDSSSKKYNSPEGYSFNYNYNEWKLNKEREMTVLFKTATDKEDFRININIIVQDLSSQPMSLEDYHLLTLNQIEQALGRNTVQSDKDVKISGNLAKEIFYTMPQSTNKANPSELKIKQIYFIKNDTAYLITYTAKIDEFATFLNSANEVFDTFKVE